MIAFHHSSFHWKAWPRSPDPHYRFSGGFVGKTGQVYQVRFHLEAACTVTDSSSGNTTEFFLGAPCRTEYTIAGRNLFQVPSDEFRMAFSRQLTIPISRRPSAEESNARSQSLRDQFQSHKIDIKKYATGQTLKDARSVVAATLNHDLMNAKIRYLEPDRNLSIALEFPVALININEEDNEFQICTGPVILPDVSTWDGNEAHCAFLADAAISSFDHVEFILRREIEAAEREKVWYEAPRGRDRLTLKDPMAPPPNYPPPRPRPLVFSEIWEKSAEIVILTTQNTV